MARFRVERADAYEYLSDFVDDDLDYCDEPGWLDIWIGVDAALVSERTLKVVMGEAREREAQRMAERKAMEMAAAEREQEARVAETQVIEAAEQALHEAVYTKEFVAWEEAELARLRAEAEARA